MVLNYTIPEPLPTSTEPLPGNHVQTSFPAAFSQERLWFIQQLKPQSAAYNLTVISRLRGPLDLSVLERSLNEIIQRHQVLRTAFIFSDNRLLQLVQSPSELKLEVVDLCAIPPAQREGELHRRVNTEVHKPFMLDRPPLLRATVLQLGEADQVLMIVLHHIVADGWSLGVFSWELTTLYGAFAADKPSRLPPLSMQFGDFAVCERQEVQGDRLQQQLAYWREQLRGPLSPLQIKPGQLRTVRPTFRGATHRMELSPELSQSLKTLCRQERVTPFMLLFASFQLMLHAYTGQTDLLVATPVINRNREELERLIGFMLNLVVLRTNVAGNPTFREFLGRVKEVVWSATSNQEVPFELILEELKLKRTLDQNPLAQVLFTFQRGPIHLQIPGLTSEPIITDSNTAKFDLFMEWWEDKDILRGRIEYSTDLFDPGEITQMEEYYCSILKNLTTGLDRRLSELIAFITARLRPKGVVKSLPDLNANPVASAIQPVVLNERISDERGIIEEELTRIWQQVLRLQHIDRHDNFFELGGHSLLIMQIVARIRTSFKVALSIEAPFEAPTIAELAAVIEQELLNGITALEDEEAGQMA
jgi:acyl carrier protein